MPLAGLEPTTPAIKRVQTYALDRATTGIGVHSYACYVFFSELKPDEIFA
jgi:hypothetical protein